MKKISVFISTYNKENVLPNALYSLSLQKTSIPFELCIADDCSTVDPEPLIRKFFPSAKYYRSPSHKGFIYSNDPCFDLCDSDSDVIVLQSADIIHTRPDSLERIATSVSDKTIVFAEVVDIPIDPTFYLNYSTEIPKILENWDSYNTTISLVLGGNTYTCSTLYTGGSNNSSWLFFLGGITKTDLMNVGFKGCGCDAVIHQRMKGFGYNAVFLQDVKAVHQRHFKSTPFCPIKKDCTVNCIRKNSEFKE